MIQRIFFNLIFSLIALISNLSISQAQNEIVGEWKQIEEESEPYNIVWHIDKYQETIKFNANGKYCVIFYAYDDIRAIEDTTNLKPKKMKAKGRYTIDSKNHIINFIYGSTLRSTGDKAYYISSNTLELVEDHGEGVRSRICKKRYMRIK